MRKFLVYQITSRRNYDVAEVLNSKRQLSFLVTDFYSLPNNKLDRLVKTVSPRFYNYFSKYRNKSIPENLIKRNLVSGFVYRFFLKYFSKEKQNKGIRISSKLLSNTSKSLLNYNAIFGFDTCSFEVFNLNAGSKELILEQCVAPRGSQISMYKVLQEKYNVDFRRHISNCENFREVEEKEWKLANKIICPSEYVKQQLMLQGVSASKIDIVPYGFSNNIETSKINSKIINCDKKDTLDVLFVGHEALRKGVLDILEVAGKFNSESNIRFHFVGKIEQELKDFNKLNYANNVIFHGKLAKLDLEELYLKSDLFFLPSYLEGSAVVIYEALSFGIPILTTFESGSVVENNINGFIVNVGDIENMSSKINLLFNDRNLLKKMSFEAYNSSREHTIVKYNQRLINSINDENDKS